MFNFLFGINEDIHSDTLHPLLYIGILSASKMYCYLSESFQCLRY